MKKRILCYGDSNTWGFDPETFKLDINYHLRYDENTRWTQLVQKALGQEYVVIEEGLNGRTNTKDDTIDEQMLSGIDYLLPCLGSAAPIDALILMLGTNDLKTRFAMSAADIVAGMERLVTIVKRSGYGREGKQPKILVISPMELRAEAGGGPLGSCYDIPAAIRESKKFSGLVADMARRQGCFYLDAQPVGELSHIDYIHFSKEGHAGLAKAVLEKIGEFGI